jgi:hypothetical protein
VQHHSGSSWDWCEPSACHPAADFGISLRRNCARLIFVTTTRLKKSHNWSVEQLARRLDAMPAGRPTEFTEELGDRILALMASGLSLAAAAAECDVHRQRVYEWEDRNPEFADTVKLARSKRQAFLERRLLTSDAGPVVTSTIFALKNAGQGDWRDKIETEHSGEIAHKVTRIELVGVNPE